jgi:hypothetical protein
MLQSVGTGGVDPGVARPSYEADDLLPSVTEVKNEWS